MKNAESAENPEGTSANMNFDTVLCSAYAASRWQLLNAIRLDIIVPGNIALDAGDIIEVRIPLSNPEGQSERLELDPVYSGKYMILGITHSWQPAGITSRLNLSKDSIDQ